MLVVIPEFELATVKARGVIPSEITVGDAVFNISRTSLLTAALASGRLDLISRAMQDGCISHTVRRWCRGWRSCSLKPRSMGRLGLLLAARDLHFFVWSTGHEGRKQELEQFLKETMQQHGIPARTRWLPPCTSGVTTELLERNGMQKQSFLDMIKGEIQP